MITVLKHCWREYRCVCHEPWLAEYLVLSYLNDDFRWVPGVGPDDQGAIMFAASLNQFLQLLAPHILTSIPDVVAVTDTCHQAFRETLQHVSKGCHLIVLTPGSDRTEINTAGSDRTEINTPGSDSTEINNPSSDCTKINTLSSDHTEINTPGSDCTKINTLSSDHTEINTHMVIVLK